MKLALALAAAVAGTVLVRSRASVPEADHWHRATTPPTGGTTRSGT